IEFKLLSVSSLNDLKPDSPQLTRLRELEKSFKGSLGLCENGKVLLTNITSLREGLENFVSADLEGAIVKFEKMPKDISLTHRLLGWSQFRLAQKKRSSAQTTQEMLARAESLEDQAITHLDHVKDLA